VNSFCNKIDIIQLIRW